MSQITGKLPHPLPEDVILDARLNILCTRKSVRDAIRSKTRELVPYHDPRLWTMVYSPTQQVIQLNPVLYASIIIFRNDGSFDLYALPSREIQQYRIPSRDASWNREYILYLSCKNLGTFQLLNYWRSGGRFLNMHRMTPCKFPFPLPCCFFCIFFCYFPWYKKQDPNGWHACPVKLIWVSQWWGLAWLYLAEIYHALAHLLPSYLVWLVLVCGIILLLFSILLTHCRTLLYISPSTYKYSQWWHQVYYVDQNRIVGYVPYMLNGEWPGFDSPDSPADIFDFKVYLRTQNSLAIGATIPRHFTRIINSNADVVFCFLVLASRYGWYDIRLDFCFTNSLWGCS